MPGRASIRAWAPIRHRRSCRLPPVSRGPMGVAWVRNMGPVSSPASMPMMVTPVCAVPGQDGALDRGRPAPARQQGGVDIDAAQARGGQDALGQQQPIGHHHHASPRPGRASCACASLSRRVSRLQDRQPAFQGSLLDWAGGELAPAPGGAVGLGVDPDDLDAGVAQSVSAVRQGTANSGVPAKRMRAVMAAHLARGCGQMAWRRASPGPGPDRAGPSPDAGGCAGA